MDVMGTVLRLLIFVGAILTPTFAISETKQSTTCVNHTCDSRIANDAISHYKKQGCFCDSQCHIYNDCCKDYKITRKEPGIETGAAECRPPSKDIAPIMMIVSCPASFPGRRSLVDKCHNNPLGQISSIPVTGRYNQLVYRNIFCALCNGEENYVFWTQRLTCKKVNDTDRLEIHEVNFTHCTETLTNPYPNTSHLCSSSLVKTCRKFTDEKCDTGSNGVVYSTANTFYKNPHCFQCNRMPDEELICEDLPDLGPATLMTYLESYFILIDFNRRDVRLNGTRRIVECPNGHWFDYGTGNCQYVLELGSSPTDSKILNCSLLKLQKDDYVLLPNETLYRNFTKTFIDKDSYMINNNSDVFICGHHKETGSRLEKMVTLFGMGISLTALALLIVFYLFMPVIWNLSGMIYLSFSFSLFFAQTLFLFPRYSPSHNVCHSIAIVMHYAFLASFFWLNIVSVNIWLSVCRNPCEMTSRSSWTRFFSYSLYAWLTPLSIIIPAVLVDKYRPDSKFAPSYGFNGVCWLNNSDGILLFFAIPLAVIILINFAAYIHTGVTIYKLRQFSLQNSGKGNVKILIINAKLCLLTGITWIFGYAASIFHSKELRIIFVILNATYGLWLAICFLTSENIFTSVRQKLRRGSHTSSTKTMS